MTISTKLKKVLFKLSNLYFPFNNLSPERLQEIVNHIRIIELQQDEILQMRGSRSQDYLYLMEGEINIAHVTSAVLTPRLLTISGEILTVPGLSSIPPCSS